MIKGVVGNLLVAHGEQHLMRNAALEQEMNLCSQGSSAQGQFGDPLAKKKKNFSFIFFH